MSNIIVQDLEIKSIARTNSFNNTESFIQELTEDDLLSINGGVGPNIVLVLVVTAVSFYALGAIAGASTC